MDAAGPLFSQPVAAPYVALRQACAEWVQFLIPLRRITHSTRRAHLDLYADKYERLHVRLCRRLAACHAIASEGQLEFLEHVRCVMEPWPELAALANAPIGILEDLIAKGREIEQRLYGNYEQIQRRRRWIMALLIVFITMIVVPPLARVTASQAASVKDEIRYYESEVLTYAQRITERQRLIVTTIVVVGCGIAFLFTSRQY
ncbi:MAG: hypothetical protein U0935_20055 [Pirellulales bacterium]